MGNRQLNLRTFAPLLLVFSLLSSACRGWTHPPAGAGTDSFQAASPSSEAQATPTAVFVPGGTGETIGQAPTPNAAAPRGNPLELVFPTPAPPPESAWRPPLYPVPWALRPQDHFFFVRPIPVDKPNWPLASYRYGGVFFDDVVHTGVDIPSPIGTDVQAAGSGMVVWAGYGLFSFTPGLESDPYGLAVAIRHDFGYRNQTLYTLYAHLSKIVVIEGQRVETGEKIGEVGETGFTTGPHLHFEVRIGQNSFFNTRNPELWIAPPQGWGVLAGRVTDGYGDPLPRQQVLVTNLETQRTWMVITYGKGAAKSDPYYGENLVIGDLPAGLYRLETVYDEEKYSYTMRILPGMVNYFRFHGSDGFNEQLPAPPALTPAP